MLSTDRLDTRLIAAAAAAAGAGRGHTLIRRLCLFALLPTTAMALLLAGLSAYWQLQALQQLSATRAETAVLQIAGIAAVALAEGDHRQLQRIATAASRQRDFGHVQILSARGEVLAEARAPNGAGAHTHTLTRSIPAHAGAAPGTLSIEMGQQQVLAAQRAHALKAALLLLCSLLGAGLIVWRAARRLGAPITALAQAATRLGRGERVAAVPVTADGEIGALQRSFNVAAVAMRDADRHQQQRIAQATQKLRRQNAALETASQARALFLAAASHDLRQPLYALTLFSSALSLGEKDPARLSRIAHIQDCVGSLDHLFNELLDLSRLDAGAMQPAPSEFPLDVLFDEISRTFRMAAEERGLRLQLRKTEAWVRCDRVMLARILNNLVSNAVRYTRRGGVLVGARRQAGALRIDVWDTGPGIADEHQAHVFEEFYQAHCSLPKHSERPGLGLGLATVQRLCALLEMPIALRSRPGRGCLFSVRVPLASAARPPVYALPAPERPLDVSGMRVLVVDDEPDILEGIQILMSSWGCEVGVAEDSDQALRLARAWPRPPDIVISDLKLGAGRSGLEVINALARHYSATAQPPFARLLITGETKSERLREISAARIPVLYKPVTPEQLREAMVATLALRQAA